MQKNQLVRGLAVVSQVLLIGALILMSQPAQAHCDSEDGPILSSIRTALAGGDIAPILKWITPADETQIKSLFERVRALRGQSEEARAVADQLFMETFVRVHRAAEGAPFTGLKPAGSAPPIMVAADRALETGSVQSLADSVANAVRMSIIERFNHALERSKSQNSSVTEGREYVEAYVTYVHFVEGLHDYLSESATHGHAAPEQGHDR
ncbi:MAG: hypothetical protein HZB43_01680 [candidate division Zixibacteria bacterium]|nr:hypothetical protein [candidate division Zixibacteria bacterium]